MSAPEPASFNPYSAPDVASVAIPENRGRRLATRFERFLATLFDGLFVLVVGWGLASVIFALGLDPFEADPTLAAFGFHVPSPLLSQIAATVPTLVEWALIASSGQSLGKKIVGLRIALADGTTARLFNGVVLRALPVHVLGMLPLLAQTSWGSGSLGASIIAMLVGAVYLADVVFIFDPAYRCLHDRMAKTWVVALKS